MMRFYYPALFFCITALVGLLVVDKPFLIITILLILGAVLWYYFRKVRTALDSKFIKVFLIIPYVILLITTTMIMFGFLAWLFLLAFISFGVAWVIVKKKRG